MLSFKRSKVAKIASVVYVIDVRLFLLYFCYALLQGISIGYTIIIGGATSVALTALGFCVLLLLVTLTKYTKLSIS
jgi:hypothetical protein